MVFSTWRDLGLARLSAPGRVITARSSEEHDGVLDEHRVGAVVGGWDLEEVPPGRLERTRRSSSH